jgi:hypothetical protein
LGKVVAALRILAAKQRAKVTREALRDGFPPGFDTVNEWAAQLDQVRRDIEQIRRDLVEIRKAPVW